MRITVKDLGGGSARLAALRPGTKVLMEGPYGRLTDDVRTKRKVTMIGAGIGVTPLRALLEDLDYATGDATLVYRASTPADFLFRAELDELSRRRGVNLFYVAGRRKSASSWLPHEAGRVDDRGGLLQLVPDLREHDVYLCGPEAWLDAAVRAVRRAGVPHRQVHVERFSW
jgi:ferredoxin-NADP reductase